MNEAALLLDLPAPRSARWLALHWLARAREAALRVEQGADPEALHDLRVAIRRLRSAMRSYRGALRGSVRGRDRRRWRDLTRGTGPARDREVQRKWLRERRPRARGAERAGIDWWIGRLDAAGAPPLSDTLDEFARLHGVLEPRLGRYRATVQLADPGGEPAFRAVFGARLSALVGDLTAALAGVKDLSQQQEAHRARIAAKHVRYLLEPFAEGLPGGRATVQELKRLQDMLGTMHDRHLHWQEVWAALEAGVERDALIGAEALLARLAADRARLFRHLHRAWLRDGAARLLRRLDRIMDALGPAPRA